MNRIVIAFSGGMDSTLLLYMAAAEKYDEIYTVSFDYGQRHDRELICAQKQIEAIKRQGVDVFNTVADVRFISSLVQTSSLTNHDIANPNIKKSAGEAQPVSYVPFRNQMFLSICCAHAESVGASKVWYGATEVDSLAGYWDGTQDFVDRFNDIASLNREKQIVVEAPLLKMSKADIIKRSINLGINLGDTWTCYSNREDGLADAYTPASSLRLKGFVDAGVRDPIQYIQQDRINLIYEQNGCKFI